LQPYEALARQLLGKELAELEYASTIAYFHARSGSWEIALDSACEFKRLNPNSPIAKSALQLAKEVSEAAN